MRSKIITGLRCLLRNGLLSVLFVLIASVILGIVAPFASAAVMWSPPNKSPDYFTAARALCGPNYHPIQFKANPNKSSVVDAGTTIYSMDFCCTVNAFDDVNCFPDVANNFLETTSPILFPDVVKGLGATCAATTPNPISGGTGNKYQADTDYAAPNSNGLSFSRQYNSQDNGPFTAIGTAWHHNYSSAIRTGALVKNVAAVIVSRPSGNAFSFVQGGGGYVSQDPDITDRLVQLAGASGWQYTVAADGSIETYDASGKLQSIQDRTGVIQTLSYSDATTPSTIAPLPGLLIRVIDSFGRQLNFTYDNAARISMLTDPAGGQYLYSYDGNYNLLSVTYPDGKTKTYVYGESANISNFWGGFGSNILTGIIDGNNTRFASYHYNNQGRADSEQHASGVDQYGLSYSISSGGGSTTITDPLGAHRTYSFTNILGVAKPTSQSQPGGSGCSASSSAISYDTNGNVASRTDFNNTKQCSTFDLTRNLETAHIEGLSGSASCPADASTYTIPAPPAGTSVTQRKISTQWHPDWRLEVRRAEPKLITTSVYNGQSDPVGGGTASCAPSTATVTNAAGSTVPIAVLCKKVEQATSDETGTLAFSATSVGAPRIWTYTYNQVGQLLTEDGPRTDVSDITTYSYYSDTSFDGSGAGHTTGDLHTLTDALGHITTYTTYDKAGRVLSSTDANGIATTSTYSPRGWLTQQAIIGGGQTHTTQYSYDNVGQLTQVTQADGSIIAYNYDAAHRLTDITDSLSNSIHYTLDAAGNRTNEAVSDPGGSLVRSTTRIFDQLGRLQNVVVQ